MQSMEAISRDAPDPTSTEFKRVASMRSLYHWNADADQEY